MTPAAQTAAKAAAPIVKAAPAAPVASTSEPAAMHLNQITIPAPQLNLMLVVTVIAVAAIGYAGYAYFKRDTHKGNFFLLLSLAITSLIR